MFIDNPTYLQNVYTTEYRFIAKYFEKHDIPILSEKDGMFYFSKTNKLQDVIDKSPLYIRWFI